MVTPERWQQPSASDIQASRSFSLSQSKEERGYTHTFRGREYVRYTLYFNHKDSAVRVCEGLMNINFNTPCARSRASAVKRGACSMSAVSTISMSFSLRRS